MGKQTTSEIRLSSAAPTVIRRMKTTDPLCQRRRIPPRRKPEAEPGLNDNPAAFGTIPILMVMLNLIWLRTIAWLLNALGLVHLMVDGPNLSVAARFYAIFALGPLIFAVAPPGPRRNPPGRGRVAKSGAFFCALRRCHQQYDEPGHTEGLAADGVDHRHRMGYGARRCLCGSGQALALMEVELDASSRSATGMATASVTRCCARWCRARSTPRAPRTGCAARAAMSSPAWWRTGRTGISCSGRHARCSKPSP
jgi:hypothetical protein